MADKILHKRSLTTGSIPTTASLEPGEIALNVPDGKIYMHKSGSTGQSIESAITSNSTASIGILTMSGSLILSGSTDINSGSVFDVAADNISFDFDSLSFSGSVEITGSLTVTNGITGSLFGTASWAENAITASYVETAQTASYVLNAVSSSYTSNALSSSYALSASYSNTSTSASFAQTASYVLPLNQDVSLSGSLKLDPTQDPDPLGLDLDSTILFQSASNTALGYDLYIRQDGNLVKWKWVEGILETGLLYGGVVTYSGSNVFVSPGSGIIAEHNATTGSEISPTVEYVTWGAITQSITNIATQQVTYLYIDNTGTLQQQSTRFTSQQYHNYIPLGAVGHFDYTQASAFGGGVQTAYDQISQISNFVDAFGPLKISGYGLTGQTGDLKLSIGSGISFIHGGFYENDPEFPSQISTPAQATASIAYVYRSGSGVYFDTNGGAFYTDIDPTQWDDGSGILQAVPGGSYTIQKVLSDPKTGILYVYYGQTVYGTQAEALSNVAVDQFTEGDTFDFTTLIGQLILKGNTLDITDTDNNIIPSGLFRGSGQGSGGGVAISNLDDLTDVSITGPTDGEALIYNSGIWQNGIPTSASFAQTASYVLNAVSSSYALTASYLDNYVEPFPYTGSALITGSLGVTGSSSIRSTTTSSTLSAFNITYSGSNINVLDIKGDGRLLLGYSASNIATGGTPQYAIAIGANAIVSGQSENYASPIAIGYDAQSVGLSSIAIGNSTRPNTGIAIGHAVQSRAESVAIGGSSTDARGTVIGIGASNTGYAGSAIGYNIDNTGASSFVVGQSFTNSLASSFVVGISNIKFIVNSNSNLILSNNSPITEANKATYFDTSATNTITISTGSAPTTNISNAFQLYSSTGSVTSNARPHFRTENGTVVWLGDESRLFNVTASRTTLSASNATSNGPTLTVYGSGSTQPVFTVQGSQGELFSVTDSLSGSLFSVNDISGLPILETFSDSTILMGNYLDPMLVTTTKLVTTASGAFTLYALPTASYDTAFFEYSIRSGSNARAGSIMAMQLGAAVNFTETTTTDFGSTAAFAFAVQVSGANMILTGSATTSGWTVKTIVRGL